MKKKLLVSILCVLLAGLLCACGSDGVEEGNGTLEPEIDIDKELEALDPDQYVTVGEIEGLTAEIAYYTFTEEDVQTCIEEELGYYLEYYDLYDYETDVSANTVKEGMIANIDYVGTVDGVAFDGGTAQGQHLLIGSGRYIPGFEEGLVDAQVGDTVDLHVTFPETYGNLELAGKAAVFTVSVNSIEIQAVPEYTDELILSIPDLGVATYDAYEESMRQYLQDSCDEENRYLLEETLWDAVYSVCEINDVPEFLVNFYINDLESYFESYAAGYNMDLETFIAQMGMTRVEYDLRNQDAAMEEAKLDMAYLAVAKAEGIVVDDAKIREVAEAEYELYGYASADDFINSIPTFNLRAYVRRQMVLERLEEKITVVELEPVSYLEYLESMSALQ